MKRLYRSRTDKKIAGICGGLGDYLDIDPTFIRLTLLFVAFFTAGFPVLIAYFIAVLFIPVEPSSKKPHEYYKRLYRSKKNKMIAGVCGGVAEFFDVDSTVIRLIFVFLTIITAIFPMFLTYIIACIVLPENPNKDIDADDKDE